MKSKFTKKPGSIIELEAELDQKEFQGYWQAAYDNAFSKVNLKGFRPGTAPKELADQAVNKEHVFEEAAHKAIRFSLDETSKDNNWTIIDAPKIEIQESPLLLKYKATIPIFPEITLGNYKKIAKSILKERKEVKVEPVEIEKTINWIRDSRAKITKVNREAHKGDFISIDVESAADSFKDEKFVLGDGHFMPGFEDKLENRKAGETLEFSLTAPENYLNEKLRGKTIDFKVKINDVYNREIPEFTDDLAQSLGTKFKTVEDLKVSIGDGLRQEKEMKESERLKIKMLDEIIKSSKMEIPEIMIQKTLDGMMNDYKPLLGKMGKNEEETRKQLYERAKNNVASNLIIYRMAEIEKLQPTPEEVGNVEDERNYNYNYGVALNKKVFQFLESQK